MKKIAFILILSSFSLSGKETKNCSTFMLKDNSHLFVGHNLDESPGLHVPGYVCINKRNQYREGITWYELIADPSEYEKAIIPFKDKPDPKIKWISLYGSVTFNSEGFDFPDGGINEKGIAIFEMSLGNTQYKEDQSNPTLFMPLWIQYQLDKCATLDEVFQNANDINLQGWTWHYFVSDADGHCAMIEFLHGDVFIHKDVDYPILCNTQYDRELDRLKKYQDYSETWYQMTSFLRKPPRFVRAAKMLDEFNAGKNTDPKEYAFKILEEIQIQGWNKWSLLVDIKNSIIYFNTNKNRKRRYFSFHDYNFSADDASKFLDIHANFSGNVSDKFTDYSYENDLKLTRERADILFVDRFKGLIDNGVTAEVYAERFADYSKRMRSIEIK